MSATTGSAIKAWIEAGSLGVSVYRDLPPDGTAVPYVTVHEDIAIVNDPASTPFDSSAEQVVEETAQVTLWQQWKNPTTNAVTENYTLASSLAKRLNGAALATAPTRVYGVLMTNMIRAVDRDNNLVQHALTLSIHRNL